MFRYDGYTKNPFLFFYDTYGKENKNIIKPFLFEFRHGLLNSLLVRFVLDNQKENYCVVNIVLDDNIDLKSLDKYVYRFPLTHHEKICTRYSYEDN